nr:MAG TPA: hypothetical protein [Caudoviricetes sp.]
MTTITIKIKNPLKRSEKEYFQENNLKNFVLEINGKQIPMVKKFSISLDQEELEEGLCPKYELERYLDLIEEFYPESNIHKDYEELNKYWDE